MAFYTHGYTLETQYLYFYNFFSSFFHIEHLQNHFIFEFWIFEFTFWWNFANKQNVDSKHSSQVAKIIHGKRKVNLFIKQVLWNSRFKIVSVVDHCHAWIFVQMHPSKGHSNQFHLHLIFEQFLDWRIKIKPFFW
jgi:hypothetical protein